MPIPPRILWCRVAHSLSPTGRPELVRVSIIPAITHPNNEFQSPNRLFINAIQHPALHASFGAKWPIYHFSECCLNIHRPNQHLSPTTGIDNYHLQQIGHWQRLWHVEPVYRSLSRTTPGPSRIHVRSNITSINKPAKAHFNSLISNDSHQ